MTKKQLPAWVKAAWDFVKPLIPVIKEKIQSGEWSGRFRKETKEEISDLKEAVQVLGNTVANQQVIIDALMKEVYEVEAPEEDNSEEETY